MVEVKLNSAVVQYPGCVLENQQIRSLGEQQQWSHTSLLGAGVFIEEEERQRYGFPANDVQETPIAAESMPLGFGVQLKWQGDNQVQDLFIKAVRSWCQILEGAAA
jgi:hypothetical protein